MTGLCEQKVALVTGGARGIGRAISRQLAAEGASIMIADVLDKDAEETLQLIHDAGGQAAYQHCDVTDPSQVQATIDATVAKFSRLDCLVNNAGIGVTAPFTDLTEADFDRITAINLKGTFLFLQSAIRQLLAQGSGGSIINMASVGGVVGTPEYSLYAMSKHGVIGLTKCTALEYAEQKIRINAVCPGPILTPMVEAVAQQQGLSDINELAKELRVPSGRLGTADEVAEAVAWLCSNRSSNTTGSSLFTDGGYTAH